MMAMEELKNRVRWYLYNRKTLAKALSESDADELDIGGIKVREPQKVLDLIQWLYDTERDDTRDILLSKFEKDEQWLYIACKTYVSKSTYFRIVNDFLNRCLVHFAYEHILTIDKK